MGSQGNSAHKEIAYTAGIPGSIPGSASSPGEGIGYPLQYFWAFLMAQRRRPGYKTWVWMIPWRMAWQPTPVYLHGESPGTEEPGGGYSPWGPKESDTTERLSTDINKQRRLPTPPPPALRKYQQMSVRNMLSLLHWLGRASLLLGFQTACLQTCTHG